MYNLVKLITQAFHFNIRPMVVRSVLPDKVLYEEIMTNDDNLESNILTSILLKMLVQVLLQVEPEICVEVSAAGKLLIFI